MGTGLTIGSAGVMLIFYLFGCGLKYIIIPTYWAAKLENIFFQNNIFGKIVLVLTITVFVFLLFVDDGGY